MGTQTAGPSPIASGKANKVRVRGGHLDDLRLIFCGACRAMFALCRRHDRGNIYCPPCQPAARRRVVRAARKRHLATDEGRADHADHQRAYRERRAARVSDPGWVQLLYDGR
ncbi:MAG: hypothetical protein WCJ30_13445 [Deltaproteobacteria bacterium]